MARAAGGLGREEISRLTARRSAHPRPAAGTEFRSRQIFEKISSLLFNLGTNVAWSAGLKNAGSGGAVVGELLPKAATAPSNPRYP